jgi:hypothetical protein
MLVRRGGGCGKMRFRASSAIELLVENAKLSKNYTALSAQQRNC